MDEGCGGCTIRGRNEDIKMDMLIEWKAGYRWSIKGRCCWAKLLYDLDCCEFWGRCNGWGWE